MLLKISLLATSLALLLATTSAAPIDNAGVETSQADEFLKSWIISGTQDNSGEGEQHPPDNSPAAILAKQIEGPFDFPISTVSAVNENDIGKVNPNDLAGYEQECSESGPARGLRDITSTALDSTIGLIEKILAPEQKHLEHPTGIAALLGRI